MRLNKWTRPDYYAGADWYDYYSAGVGQNRDSNALDRSNFQCMLRELGGESDTVIVVREGHWAVGWVEWIAIHESDTRALEIASEIMDALEDYPVIDESHFSEMEYNEANEIWSNCYSALERIRYVRENRSQFDFADYADMINCIRGNYFCGYASELIGY